MLADMFDVFLFDLDGVVYVGEGPLPRAKESLSRLRGMGKEVRFLTNDPRPTREEVIRKLVRLGVEAREGEVVTSGRATASHLRRAGARSAYVVGSPGLKAEVQAAGVEVLDAPVAGARKPEAVVVGVDRDTSYADVEVAARLVTRGAIFVATNPDGSFPTPDGSSPGAGAVVAAVAAACGKRPDATAGKPHPAMFEAALAGLRAPKERTAMVGDNPETDVLGAHRAGIAAILISGEPTAFPSARDFRAPDAAIPDLSYLFDPELSARKWEKPSFPWPERVAAGVAAVVFDGSGGVLLGKRADNGLWGCPRGAWRSRRRWRKQ